MLRRVATWDNLGRRIDDAEPEQHRGFVYVSNHRDRLDPMNWATTRVR